MMEMKRRRRKVGVDGKSAGHRRSLVAAMMLLLLQIWHPMRVNNKLGRSTTHALCFPTRKFNAGAKLASNEKVTPSVRIRYW